MELKRQQLFICWIGLGIALALFAFDVWKWQAFSSLYERSAEGHQSVLTDNRLARWREQPGGERIIRLLRVNEKLSRAIHEQWRSRFALRAKEGRQGCVPHLAFGAFFALLILSLRKPILTFQNQALAEAP